MVSRIAVISGRSRSLLNFRGPLIKEFLKAGLEVHAFAPDFEDNQVVTSSLKEIGVICHQTPMARTGMNPFYDIKTIFYLFLKLTSIKPTYLFSYNLKPVIYSGIAAYFAGVPRRFSLITGLGYAFSNHNKMIGKIVGLISRNLYRLVLKRNEKVFFQNGDDLRQFEDLGIINSRSSSLVVNGSGVDVNYFYQCTHFPRELSFLLIARFLASKGIREYVCAAKKIKKKYPDVSFKIAGYIEDNPDSISQGELDSWVKGGIVQFLGRLDDVRQSICESSIYVLPSYREGTPRTVLEAMSMGRPVITTDAPGCRETVIDGRNGFLVQVRDSSQLAQAMQYFIDDHTLLSKMGSESRKIAEQKYDVHKVNKVMLDAMQIYS